MTTDPIRAKIVELVPEIETRTFTYSLGHRINIIAPDQRITLADVLRAIETIYDKKVRNVKLWSGAEINEMKEEQAAVTRRWNLTTDYDNQTQEVKEFLGSLLGVTN